MTRAILLALVLASCGVGCAGARLPPSLVPQARGALEQAAAPLRDAAPKVNKAGAVLAALCAPTTPPSSPVLPPDTCAVLVDGFNAGATALGNVQAAIVGVDAALAVIEAVQGAQ